MTTTDHKIIKDWIIKHKGFPEIIDAPDATGDERGIRINFPGDEDDKFLDKRELHETTWEDFFQLFEEQLLAFEYSDSEYKSDPSMSYHFIKRSAIEEESYK
jgi:hypothetical protein